MKTTQKASTLPYPGPKAYWRLTSPQLGTENLIKKEPVWSRQDTYDSPVCPHWPAVYCDSGAFVRCNDMAVGTDGKVKVVPSGGAISL